MKKIEVQIKPSLVQNYPIFVGKNILKLGAEFIKNNFKNQQVACLIDSNVAKLFSEKIEDFCSLVSAEKFIFPAGEEHKNIFVIEKLTKELLSKNLGRKTLICNIGGGVVCDAGGFLAASFMRGVPFVQIPTSLLAMVDASVGGKVAIDIDNFKNSFGCFSSPAAIFADLDFLEKLPEKEFQSGLGECLKHGILGSPKILNSKIDRSELTDFVIQNIQLKKSVVEKDFKETGIRALLNLGHTIGHAIESLFLNTKNQISHGEAVVLGVLAEAEILENMKILATGSTQKIEEIFLDNHFQTKIATDIDQMKLWGLAQKDKKNENGQVFISRITTIGDNLKNNDVFKVVVSKDDFLCGINSILKTQK